MRYHPSRPIIRILKLLFIPLETIDFILEALDVVDGALKNRSLVRLSNVKILNDVVEKFVDLR
jgi:hypothetical protein